MTPEDIKLLGQIFGPQSKINEIPFAMGDPRAEEERKRQQALYEAERAKSRQTYSQAPLSDRLMATGKGLGYLGSAMLESMGDPYAKLAGKTTEGALSQYFTPKTPVEGAALSEMANILEPVGSFLEDAKIPDITPGMLTSPTRLIDDAARQASMGLQKGAKAAARSTEDILRSEFAKAPVGSIKLPETQREPDVNPLGFYSELGRAADSLRQERGTGQQFLSQLRSMPGVKADELKWTGLDDFLSQRDKVTKSEIRDYLSANQVQVEEVRLGEMSAEQSLARDQAKNRYREIVDAIADTRQKVEEGLLSSQQARAILEPLSAERSRLDNQMLFNVAPATKFRSYSVPGGKNYRELLLTLPRKEPRKFTYQVIGAFPQDGFKTREEAQKYIDDLVSNMEKNPQAKATFQPMLDKYPFSINEYEAPESRNKDFRSTHFNEPNILAHMRVSDFEQDGKRVMLVDEIQSDWGQKGRDEGFAPKDIDEQLKENEERRNVLTLELNSLSDRMTALDDTQLDEFLRLNKERGRLADLLVQELDRSRDLSVAKRDGVLSAPFVTSTEGWVNLTLRRAIQEASEKGFDKVAIPVGRVQVERYPEALRQVADEIVWDTYGGNVRHVMVKKNGATIFGAEVDKNGIIERSNESSLIGKNLEEVIGKPMTQKTISEEAGEIKGEDFTVGGKGMETFYDQIVPKYLNKLGSKFGTKVTRGTIKNAKGEDVPVHKMTITPQMRESVLKKGQPLFAAVPAVGLTQEEEGYKRGGAVRKRPVSRLKPGARFVKFANGGPVSGIKPYHLDAKAARKVFDVPGVGPVEMFVDEASKRMVVSDEGYWNPKSPVGAALDKVVQWARDQGYQAGVVVTPYASERFGEDMVANVNRRMAGATDDQLREYVNAADFVIVDPYVVNEESATPDFQNWMSTFTKNVGQYAQDQGKDAWLYLQGFAPSSVGNEVIEGYNQRLIDENKDTFDQLSFFNMSDFPDFEDSSWAQQINVDKLYGSLTPEASTMDPALLQSFENELNTRIDGPVTQLDRLATNTDLGASTVTKDYFGDPDTSRMSEPITPVVQETSFSAPDTSVMDALINPVSSAPPALEIDYSFGAKSPYEKAQEYNRLLKTSSDADIRNAANRTFGQQSDGDWSALQQLAQSIQPTTQMASDQITTTRQLAAGGAIKKAVKAASKAPEVKKMGQISELEKRMRELGGDVQAKRVQQAADLVPDLERQFQMQALERAFGGRMGSPFQALAVIDPANFESYASPIPVPVGRESRRNIDELRGVLQSGGFEDVPFLDVGLMQGVPKITGHEGRHRTRAMSESGIPKTLVEIMTPRVDSLREMGRKSPEEYRQALDSLLGEDRIVVPEGAEIDNPKFLRAKQALEEAKKRGDYTSQYAIEDEINRYYKERLTRLPDLERRLALPPTFAAGGAIKKAAKAAKAASKASDVKEQPIYWGMYRGYVGDDVSSTEPQFAAMDKNVAEYYARKRAAQTGLPPHLEMIYKQLDAGRKYGHTVPIDQHNRELLITQAYELQPEDIKGRYQLKKQGGLASVSKR